MLPRCGATVESSGNASAPLSRARSVACLLALQALTACSSVGSGSQPPLQLRDLPEPSGPVHERITEARRLGERGREEAALALLRDVIRDDPRNVEAHRARQDLLRGQGRIGLVLQEARDRVAAWEGDSPALYLEGRVQRSPEASRALFEDAIAQDPSSFWGWHGLAFTMRQSDPDGARALYERLYRATSAHPLVAIAYASHLRATDDVAMAADSLLRHPGWPGGGPCLRGVDIVDGCGSLAGDVPGGRLDQAHRPPDGGPALGHGPAHRRDGRLVLLADVDHDLVRPHGLGRQGGFLGCRPVLPSRLGVLNRTASSTRR